MLEKDLQATEENLENLNKQLTEKRGIYQTMLCDVMDEMNLQCQVYHRGSLVGNDVRKLTKPENISKISDVFKPLSIQLSSGEFKGFSSNENVVKMRTLLTKFKQCYDLYTASRPCVGTRLLSLVLDALVWVVGFQ